MIYKYHKRKLVKDINAFLKNKKMWLYCCDWYKNLPKDEKQRLVEYRKKYYNMRINSLL